jgi:hypothetical protein
VEVILIGDQAAVIDFHVNEIGVDAVNGCAEGLEKHWVEVAPSVTPCGVRRDVICIMA